MIVLPHVRPCINDSTATISKKKLVEEKAVSKKCSKGVVILEPIFETTSKNQKVYKRDKKKGKLGEKKRRRFVNLATPQVEDEDDEDVAVETKDDLQNYTIRHVTQEHYKAFKISEVIDYTSSPPKSPQRRTSSESYRKEERPLDVNDNTYNREVHINVGESYVQIPTPPCSISYPIKFHIPLHPPPISQSNSRATTSPLVSKIISTTLASPTFCFIHVLKLKNIFIHGISILRRNNMIFQSGRLYDLPINDFDFGPITFNK